MKKTTTTLPGESTAEPTSVPSRPVLTPPIRHPPRLGPPRPRSGPPGPTSCKPPPWPPAAACQLPWLHAAACPTTPRHLLRRARPGRRRRTRLAWIRILRKEGMNAPSPPSLGRAQALLALPQVATKRGRAGVCLAASATRVYPCHQRRAMQGLYRSLATLGHFHCMYI
jgi:hypothetical protein